MSEETRQRLQELLEEGKGAGTGSRAYVPVLTFESEAILGLDAEGGWVVQPPDGTPRRFEEAQQGEFFEAIETARRDFDGQILDNAGALGLDGEAVLASFPAAELVQQVLTRRSSYYARLALLWLLPSELRELRSLIAALAEDRDLPKPVRALAERLTVPEHDG